MRVPLSKKRSPLNGFSSVESFAEQKSSLQEKCISGKPGKISLSKKHILMYGKMLIWDCLRENLFVARKISPKTVTKELFLSCCKSMEIGEVPKLRIRDDQLSKIPN